jgi:hypothetical protein
MPKPIEEIHSLQNQVSIWHTKVCGVKPDGPAWKEMLEHLIGASHFAVLKVSEMQTKQPLLEKGLLALNTKLQGFYQTYSDARKIGVEKEYAGVSKKAVDDFKTIQGITDLPDYVNDAYKKVAALAK